MTSFKVTALVLFFCLVASLLFTACGVLGSVKDDIISITERNLNANAKDSADKYSFKYFTSLSKAISAVNDSTVDTSADSERDGAVAAALVSPEQCYVILLQDTKETETIKLSRSMTINLGGKKVDFEGCKIAFDCRNQTDNTITIDAKSEGSGIAIENSDKAAVVFRTGKNSLIVNGGTYLAQSRGEAAKVYCVIVDKEGKLEMNGCDIDANAHYLYEEDKGYVALSIGISNDGTAVLNDCNVFGTHSGVQSRGSITVNGGIYESIGHGGIYFCGGGTVSYVKRATLRDCQAPEGFEHTSSANQAGFYIGGSSGNGVTVYMDSCTILGGKQPIVLRGTSGESGNTLYISNSIINHGTEYGIRIDNDSHKLYIGKGNNFSAKDIKARPGIPQMRLKLMVTATDEVYCND